LEEAINGLDGDKWHKAVEDEYNALKKAGTFVLVPKPEGRHIVTAKWVFKTKLKADGSIDRLKARWVARGFTQIHGIDYNDTFAPVVRYDNLRLLLAYAANKDLEVHSMDVDSAFLYGDLEEEVFIYQPEGFKDPLYPDHVCKLLKGLYGLKQASNVWHGHFDKIICSGGYMPTKVDPCIYMKVTKEGPLFMCVWVDDCTLIGTPATIKQIKAHLKKYLKMKDLGLSTETLGFELLQDRVNKTISLRQTGRILRLALSFGLSQLRPRWTPMAKGILFDTDCIKPDPATPYRELVGAMCYIASVSRPDISFAASYLARFTHCYTDKHWTAAKSVLAYLLATKDMAIVYTHSSSDFTFYGHCDADWGGREKSDSKSTSGYIFFASNAQYLGHQKSNQLLHYPLVKQSTFPLLKHPNKLHIFAISSALLEFPNIKYNWEMTIKVH